MFVLRMRPGNATGYSSIALIWLLLLLLLWGAQIISAFVNSPKIITKDGNLLFESGLNRNITFRLNGISRLTINDEYDVLSLLDIEKSKRGPTSESATDEINSITLRELAEDLAAIKIRAFGTMDQRIRRLQNRTRIANQMLRRYRVRLQTVETEVQTITEHLETDNCKSNPCENGGICFNMFKGFMCKCTNNFEGPTCAKDVNECALFSGTDAGCQNEAQCVNLFGGYNCICNPGWFGIHCTQRRGDCMQSSTWELCSHGTCVNTNDNNFGYKCICDQGWKTNGLTPACQVDVDECTESHPPCVTRCINLPGSFTCAACTAGLTGNGVKCYDIDECALDNGGCSTNPRVQCLNTYGSYHCGACPVGWSGDGRTCIRVIDTGENAISTGVTTNCANNNICHSNATCTVVSSTVVCSCPLGMVGNGIGANGCVQGTALNCNSLPCQNGGTCIDAGPNNYTCICPLGFRQPNCIPGPSSCVPNPCQNGGRCVLTNAVDFQCQCAPGYIGRLCNRRFTRCGGLLSGLSGSLKFPSESTMYMHDEQCSWVLRTNETLVLNVTFNDFRLESSRECSFDWLQINDGKSSASQVIGRFCGTHKPRGGNIISTTNFLYLWFRSDNSTAGQGFDLTWNSIPPVCGGVIEVETHGTIASPGAPGNYPKNRDCRWQLRAPNDKRLKLTFFNLQIENHDTCNYDYLEITDAISGELLERYCNSSRPTPLLLPTNEVFLHFHSDNEDSDTGFQIYYSTEQRVPGCGGIYTSREGIIKSPIAIAIAITNSVSCEYDIKLASSESMKIEFLKFELNETDCIEFYDINTEQQINALQSKFCGDYGITPPAFNSFYNHVRIKFYSKGGQFELKYKADCIYKFEGESGTIMSPGYPGITRVERYCAYKILTAPNTVISLNVVDFDLNDSSLEDDDCAYTYLKIDDFNGRNITGPSCSKNLPPLNMVSSANSLTVHFQSALTSIGTGFKITYRAIPMGDSDCGGVYTKPGSIRLPTGDDGEYMHDMECYWIIMAPAGKDISLIWKSINLESSPDCTYDYIEIYDNLANTKNAKHFGRYCQSNPPMNILSQSRMLTIKFVSDSSEASDGFEATFDFVDSGSQCNMNITSSTGKLTSPNWPGNYSNDLNCSWTISGPQGTQIELLIDMFELEESTKCTKDWFEVRNGGTAKSVLIGSYCGKSIPKRLPAFTNQLYLHLHSDSFINARGFTIRWQVFSNGCGGKLTSGSGEITSPMYPNPYPHMARCEWRIIVHKGSSIHLTIEDMDIEELFNCNYDHLSIFDGRSTRIPLLVICQLLDENKPVQVVSKSNELTIRFITDETNNGHGFLLSYYSNCTRTITATYGVIDSINYGESFYRNDVDCAWTIQAPKGNRIILDFFYFDKIDKNAQLYVVESTINGTITKKFNERDTYNSTGDRLTIVHNNTALSFQLEYTMVGCIQTLHHQEGEFSSPNYPKMYSNNMECFWEIRAPIGHSIVITIEEIDLEESTNCTKDYLMISNDVDSVNPKERHCGKQDMVKLPGISGFHLYVRFSSDAQNNGKGFKASYHITESICGGTVSGRNGVIKSPNYPLNYPGDTECEWNIEVTRFHTITLTIEELDVEDFYDCEMDYVEAFEYSDDNKYEEVKLFRKCGNMEDISGTEWTTMSNKAIVRFKSDDSQERKGFKISFKENCGERLIVEENYEYSISRNAQGNETCIWQFISEDSTRHIMFRPTHVLLRTRKAALYKVEGDCINEGIKVYDGDNDKGPLLSQFCITHPNEITSYGNYLTVKVPFGVIGEFVGVYAIMDSYCGADYDGIRGKFSTPQYPSSYSVDIDCEWNILASVGNSMVLTFESMDLEYSEECNKDYVEVRETDERGRLLGLFCGNTIPEPIISTKSIWMKFSSDDDIVGEGLLVSYNYAMHNEISGENGTIESPRFPSKFHSNDPYSWRITVNKDYVILLTMEHIIDMDIPHIKFYDGYSDIGVQIDYRNSHVVRSNTNILFFTASRGPFQFEWVQLSKDEMRSNQSAEMMSQLCGKETIVLGSSLLVFGSPGYPEGYGNDLNCKWKILPSNQAQHATISFTVVDLEDFGNCYADYVRISSSSDLENWKQLDSLCKKTPGEVKEYHGTPYLLLEFVTDSGVNKTGFSALIRPKCGSEMTDRRGFVNITTLNIGLQYITGECVWTIKVRQGRRIRIKFLDSYLSNSNDTTNCLTYFMVRNGLAEDSPFLGKGKYCENNITDVLETTSNRAYIKFVSMVFPRFKASFHYEEISHACSDEITLSDETSEDSVKTITSPNYPNIPHPHTECIWKVTAPNHHIIVIEFLDDFNVGDIGDYCKREYVQLNDGATDLMPSLGMYCGKTKPNSKYTSGNVLRLKYVTDISEPRTGFKANVSIGRCGGSYYASDGIINSPDLLYTQNIPENFECVYTIEMEQGSNINLTVHKMQLPSDDNCSFVTHLELKEIDQLGDEEFVSDTVLICGVDHTNYIVETNKLIIRYKIKGTPSTNDIFQLRYSAIGHRCGETITASMGLLKTPGYPSGVQLPTHCTWRLRVPKGKRIKVEVLDFDTGAARSSNTSANYPHSFRGRLSFSNDFLMQSIITRFADNPPASVYSTDNTMMIDAFLLAFSRHRGFKLRFSSDEDSVLCHKILGSNSQGNIHFTSLNDTSVYCSYDLEIGEDETFVFNVDKYEKGNTSYIRSICGFISPLKMRVDDTPLLPYMMCDNGTLPTLRIPVPLTLELSANKRNKLQLLDLRYKVYKCGGRRRLTYDENDKITEPVMNADFNGLLECAWLISETYYYDTSLSDSYFEDNTLQIELSINFKGKCEEQYLVLYNGPSQNYPELGRYCGQTTAENLVVKVGLFFEYYTASYETESKFNISVKVGSGCGGVLTYPYRKIQFSEEYKNNVECIWDIVTELGFHIGLSFEGRFFIEQSENCKKDYLKIQQKNTLDNDWIDIKTVCGRTPPDSINTTSTQMRMIFRSDGNITADGFKAKFERNCGGIQYATSIMQQLSSPGYPKQYGHNLYCNYTILPKDPNDAGVLIQFIDFEVEEPPMSTCLFDNVSVYRYSNDDKEEKTVLCGKGKTYEFRAKKRISIVLSTDQSFANKGFLLNYSSNVCGGQITNSSIIRTPLEYDENHFPHNSNCDWIITAPPNKKILIKFEEFDFEKHHECYYDSVEVYKGTKVEEDQRMVKLCGNLTGRIPIISIPSNEALIHSFSDDRDNSKGFTALISFVLNCDRHIYLSVGNSTFTFSMYANGYDNNLDCSYVFETLPGRQFVLDFSTFHIEESDKCQDDYLEIRDGSGPFADLIGQYCGHTMPGRLMSSRNSLFIRFVTDSEKTSSGFLADISSVPLLCGQHIVDITESKKAILKSPGNSEGKYLKNLNCFWKIKSDNNIHLKFDKLDIEGPNSAGSCSDDYLTIYNSEDAKNVEKGYSSTFTFNGRHEQYITGGFATQYIYCGNGVPDDFFSTSKTLYVKFKTNEEGAQTGFQLTATSTVGCFRNFTGTQGRIQLKETKEHCDVYIRAPENYTLSIYYATVSFAEYDCNKEYIEVFDAHTNSSLQKICTYTDASKSLFTNTSELRLNIKMNSFYTNFDITYLASQHGPGCGGSFYSTSGILTNPFYPNNVRNYSDCSWHIRVPSNLRVMLYFEVFNLGAKATCHSDYLQILESQPDGSQRVMRQFCGEDKPQVYRSEKNVLTVRFHKTVNYDGTGWVLHFHGIEDDFETPLYFIHT